MSIPQDTQHFIYHLTGHSGEACAFACLDDNPHHPDREPLPAIDHFGTLEQVWPALKEANDRGYGIFVAINAISKLPRRNENVTRVRAVFADFDAKHGQAPPAVWPLPPSLIVKSGGGFHAYWLCTPGSPVPLDRFNVLQGRLAKRLGSDAQGTKGLPRLMRLPGTDHHKTDTPRPVELLKRSSDVHQLHAIESALPDPRLVDGARALSRGWKAGQGHDSCLALAGALARAEWDIDRALLFVNMVCEMAGMLGPENGEVTDTFTRHGDGVRVTGWSALIALVGKKPVAECREALGELALRQDKPIVWVGAEEAKVAREMLGHLVANGATFVRGGSLVYAARDAQVGIRIYRYTRNSLRSHLTDVITCVRPAASSDSAPVQLAPPDAIVLAIIDTPTLWEAVPSLVGVVDYPVLTPSGRILVGQGYDEETGLWMDSESPETVPLSDAVEVLNEPLCDFPLTDQGRAGVLALVLTILTRPAIRGATPAFVFDSNAPRVGKKKLVDVACLIATGRPAAVTVQPYNDDEMRKRVLAILESGASVALVDDCKRSIGGGVVDPLLTAFPSYSDRRLGVSELVDVPAETVWTFTGTNVEIRDHTANRIIPIRATTDLEDPSRRGDFRHPQLETYVRENTPLFRGAAIALIKGWIAAGSPADPSMAPMGSYEAWGSVVRAILLWAGVIDPVPATAQTSTELGGAALLYDEIERLAAGDDGTPLVIAGEQYRGLRTLSIIRLAIGAGGFAALGAGGNPALDEALAHLVAGERTPRRVGFMLRTLKGRVISDGEGRRRALQSARARDNTSVWYLQPLGGKL